MKQSDLFTSWYFLLLLFIYLFWLQLIDRRWKKNVCVYLITNKRIKLLTQYPVSGKVISAAFIDQTNTIVVQIDNQLRVLPSNAVFKHDVMTMTPSLYSYLIFVKTPEKMEIYYNKKWEDMDIKPMILAGFFPYHLPEFYDRGSMHTSSNTHPFRKLYVNSKILVRICSLSHTTIHVS